MDGHQLKHILLNMTEEELNQPVQVHDHKEGEWHSKIDVEPNHDGVLEIAIKY